jgi:RNase P subunit RPR2
MQLPKLDTPTYTMIVPSTQKEVKFRPYVVKEEKILLMAAEAQDEKAMLREIIRIVEACTFNDLEIHTLTLYDLEFIFLNLRMKSVGETSKISLKCAECGHLKDFEINLQDIKLQWPEGSDQSTIKTIMLNDQLGIKVSHIPALAVEALSGKASDTEKMLTLISQCVVEIFNQENVWRREDSTPEEIQAFIEQFTNPQLQEVQRFISSSPELSYTVKWNCDKCGHKNSEELKGLSNFF